jgi:hypothetical protein
MSRGGANGREFMDQPARDLATEKGTLPDVRNELSQRCAEGGKKRLSPYQTSAATSSGGFACKPTFHRIGVHQAGLLELKATASEYGEVWNSPDVVSRGKFREPFRVDLKHHGSAREVPRDLCNMRRRHPARAAPGRPEINEHGNFAVANNFVEFLGSHFHGLCHRR